MSEATTVTTVELTPEQQAQEAQAAFTAGYNKVRGESPAKTSVEPEKAEAPAKTEPETPAKADAAQAAPDPWEGISPIIKTTLGSIADKLGALDRIDHRLKSAEGRIGAIQTGMEAARAAAKAGVEAPTKEQVTAATQSTEKWEQIKKDFPEWAEAMDERLASQAAALKPAAPVDVEALRKQLQNETSAAINQSAPVIERRARELSRVDLKHPTWEDDVYVYDADGNKVAAANGAPVYAPEFDAWIKAQAPEIKALADSDKSKDAIHMLDLFYEHKKVAATQAAAEAKRNQRLAAVVPPKTAASSGPSILPDEAGLAVGYKKVKRA